MTSVDPYVANLNRGYTQSSTTTAARESQPTATLHYMPPHQQSGQLLQSQIGFPQQQPQHGPLPRQPLTGQLPPPHNAAPSQKMPTHRAAPPITHCATQQSKQHKAGDKREMREAYSTGAVAKHSHVQDIPMNSCNYPILGRSQGQKIGHNLPVAVMPVRQRPLPAICNWRTFICNRT